MGQAIEIVLYIFTGVALFVAVAIFRNAYFYEGVYTKKDVDGLSPGDVVKYIDEENSNVKQGIVIIKGRYGCSVALGEDPNKYENVLYKNIMWIKK